MDTKMDLMTIKEFAAAAGVTQQAIYKQVGNKLQNYVVQVDNRKMLKVQALKEVYGIEVEEYTSTVKQKVGNDFNQVEQPSETQENDKIVDILEKELQEKNQQIADLPRQIESLTKLVDQQQQLSLMDRKKILELENKLEQQQAGSEGEAADQNDTAAAADQNPEQEKPAEPQKKTLWQRLFGG